MTETSHYDAGVRAERIVLGTLLTYGDLFPQTEGISIGDFRLGAHKSIFGRMAALFEDGQPIELNFLVMDLERAGRLEACGGDAYISSLVDHAEKPGKFGNCIAALRRASIEHNIAIQIEQLAAASSQVNFERFAILRDQLSNLQQLFASYERCETNTPAPDLFETAEQLATDTEEETEWIVPGFVASGSMTNIDAKIKLGKTTFALDMSAKVLDGKEFLGKPTKKTPVVYLTEQPRASFKQALKRAAILGHKNLHVLRWQRVSRETWPEIVAKARAKCAAVGAKLLIVDTIGQFAGFKTEEENSSGPWMEAMRPLQELMADGVAVVNLMHSRKSGGDVGDSARGSSAGGGVADILISIRRPEGNHGPSFRRIESLSRFDETPTGLVIELTPEGYIPRGSSDTLAADETRAKLYATLPTEESEAMTMKAIQKETGAKRPTLLRVIQEDGTVKKIGQGGRSDPFRYYRPNPHQEQV